MFGYATDETEECMPLTIILAHKLNAKMAELRRNGALPWLRPDSKTQVRKQSRTIVFICLLDCVTGGLVGIFFLFCRHFKNCSQ